MKRLSLGLGIALYPVVVLALFPIHLWATSFVSPNAAIRALVVTVAVGLLIGLVCRVAAGDKHRGGLIALIVAIAVLIGGRSPALAIASVVGLSVLVWVASRRQALDWEWMGRQLRRVTTVLALAILIELIGAPRPQGAVAAADSGPRPVVAATANQALPDVYVILLDGYPRHDVLQSAFNVDDSPFLDGLAERGFEVAPASHSNYILTIPSLATFLNFRHIADMDIPAEWAIADSAVVEAFRSLGYETVTLASGFEDSAVRSADRYLDGGQINNFEVAVLQPTLIASALAAVDPDAFSRSQRDRIEWEFATLAQLAAESAPRPRFVFAHIPSPHRPWVVHADGSPMADPELETWYYGPDFFTQDPNTEIGSRLGGQVQFVGSETLRAVDEIMAATDQPPVIIVMSDHGIAVDHANSNGEMRLRNLFAAYTPGQADLFPSDTTLVNLFPTIFEAYLGTDLPRSPEDLYVAGPKGVFDPIRITP